MTPKELFQKLIENGIKESTDSEIKVLMQHMEKFMEDRRDPEEKITRALKALQKSYDDIEWGDDWTDSKSSDAEGELYSSVSPKMNIAAKSILTNSTLDVQAKWKYAITFTEIADRIIERASDCGYKLVNGSHGEWCPDAAEDICEFWRSFIKSSYNSEVDEIRRELQLSAELVEEAKSLEFWKSDYMAYDQEYFNWPVIQGSKRAKTGDKEADASKKDPEPIEILD